MRNLSGTTHGFAAFYIFRCYPLPLVGISTACQYHVRMRLIGNILWLILGGLFLSASWAVIGGGTVRHHHRYSVRHSIVQDGQTSAMAVRLANPQLVTTSDHFTQHRRPSTAVWHISIEELRSEQAVTTAP